MTIRRCNVCSTPLSRRQKVYCSLDCQAIDYRIRAPKKDCALCGDPLEMRGKEGLGAFIKRECCSQSCASRLMWRRKGAKQNETRECVICDAAFESGLRDRQTCGDKCANKLRGMSNVKSTARKDRATAAAPKLKAERTRTDRLYRDYAQQGLRYAP